jgi:hypothetical protein
MYIRYKDFLTDTISMVKVDSIKYMVLKQKDFFPPPHNDKTRTISCMVINNSADEIGVAIPMNKEDYTSAMKEIKYGGECIYAMNSRKCAGLYIQKGIPDLFQSLTECSKSNIEEGDGFTIYRFDEKDKLGR